MTTRRSTPEATGKKGKKVPSTPVIRASMTIGEILTLLPEAGSVMAQYGLHCAGCHASFTETLEEGYMSHGFAEDELDDLLTDLNDMLKRRPPRPAVITVTRVAADALTKVAEEQGIAGQLLEVIADEVGGYCMEARADATDEHLIFFHPKVPDVRVVALPDALARVGGAIIDYRDGRFKLDLDTATSCACHKESCGCGGGCSC